VPAMINFTAGVSNILAACEGAELGAIVTRVLRGEGPADKLVTAIAEKVKIVISEDSGDRHRQDTRSSCREPLVDRKADDRGAICSHQAPRGVPEGVVLSIATSWRSGRRRPASTSA